MRPAALKRRILQTLGEPAQMKPTSTLQNEQPSPLESLASSQASGASTTPSPQPGATHAPAPLHATPNGSVHAVPTGWGTSAQLLASVQMAFMHGFAGGVQSAST